MFAIVYDHKTATYVLGAHAHRKRRLYIAWSKVSSERLTTRAWEPGVAQVCAQDFALHLGSP